jgi:hypothetical protein
MLSSVGMIKEMFVESGEKRREDEGGGAPPRPRQLPT